MPSLVDFVPDFSNKFGNMSSNFNYFHIQLVIYKIESTPVVHMLFPMVLHMREITLKIPVHENTE